MNKIKIIKIIILLIGASAFGCTKKADNSANDKSNVHELPIDKMVRVEIDYSTTNSTNVSSINPFRTFISDKRADIISNFHKFLNRDMDFISYTIEITDSAVFRLDKKDYGMIKVTLTAHGADYGASGNNVYLIDLTNKSSIAYQTGFFLPECGVADLSFESVGKFKVLSKTYYLIKRNEATAACCGASKEDKTNLVVFDTNTFSTKVGEITTFHKNYFNDFCGVSKPAVITKANLYALENDLVLISVVSADHNRKIYFDTTYITIDEKIKIKN